MQLTRSIGPSAEFVQDDQTEVVWLYTRATHNVCMLTNINLCIRSLEIMTAVVELRPWSIQPAVIALANHRPRDSCIHGKVVTRGW